MSEVNVTLPDGSVLNFPAGTTVKEVAFDIGPRLGKASVAGVINGDKVDLDYPIKDDVDLEIITIDSEEGLEIYRHSIAHIMAQAVKRVFGKDDVELAIGPAIDDGFYYDFDLDENLSDNDIEKIEEEMNKIIKDDLEFKRIELSKEEAIEKMKEMEEDYKVEMLEEFKDDKMTFYRQGDFVDLCRGPHLPSTGKVKAFKLLNVAGAYWRGDENNKMLQRIYGTAFPKKSELEEHLHRLEEAKKRDHRKLGKELDLFSLQEEGPGFPFFHPKGMVIWNQLENFWKEEHSKRGYQQIKTPIILNQQLWKQSGHWDHYQENMYFTEIDEDDYAVKPMNCPGSVLVYKNQMHSYRDFPIRMGELGLVHRHERSGTLHGLMRVRSFTQDDAHIFMLPSQIKDELTEVIDLIDYFYNVFGFKYHVELSTKPEKAMGSDELWEEATDALKDAIVANDLDYTINEGDGAFYGPKIDFHLEDCLGRTWQCGTIQLDFQMPERFDLTYVGEDGEEHRPVMIHRVVFGSLERFIGILIEHFGGAFPNWLAPIQTEIIPITDDHLDYAYEVKEELAEAGIRVEVDARQEKVGYKIRQAQVQQIPYMLIVGDNEVEAKTVSVRERREGDLGEDKVNDFKEKILKEIENKS
ncbi:threonine--tRNA ligase [Selenihalanaerobacter shriftii]|uniref:Threonine--tRNA ligase n=1 Tax=Selenihalanaerobacter shriftii TaxID=142842 RepID=A0A1T4PRP1_9FIRM|nr:threonine--tRNA ligase [Selenihalanaerobacter shriftii]SJZ94250.1 threonyl-tRNA synthetase [Selenihalanaerobacter shriftii]